MSKYILSGMQYGDEGKGSFVDFLTYEHNVDCVVKYNGGSQASHTVKTPKGQLHKFSQLGSGMFNPECHTYIAENMVVNLDNLLFEIEVFSTLTGEDKFDIVRRMHVHEDCYLVTPYHKLMNRIRELSVSPDERRGTVGTGVSEVRKFLETPFQHLRNKVGDNVYMLLNQYHGNRWKADVTSCWENLLAPQHVIKIHEEKSVVDLMLGIISLSSSARTLETYRADLVDKGQTNERIQNVMGSLEKLEERLAAERVETVTDESASESPVRFVRRPPSFGSN